MLRPRIIPCLLVQNGGLVKTVRFGQPKYVGDPINAVRIFNEKEVDEIIVVDIDATVRQQEPNYKMVANLAAECRMPLCYGGGVKTAEQIQQIISLGVEKVAVSAAVIQNPELISEAASQAGGQSIVVVMDVKKAGLLRRYEVFTHNGTKGAGVDPVTFARQAETLGAGEVVVNSIDHDGDMKGYDFDLLTRVHEEISIPLTALGGAGSLDDIASLIQTFGIIGAAAGSFFVFKGKYRAVLISYPGRDEKENLYQRAGVVK
jgi:imidazole glycerol-phosphate synthase subunit HisF